MAIHYTLEEIANRVAPIAQQFGVEKLALFGSYARGEEHEGSDLDFLIERGSIQGWEFFGLMETLEEELGLPVDVMTYESLFHSPIREAIKDEVVLYERKE